MHVLPQIQGSKRSIQLYAAAFPVASLPAVALDVGRLGAPCCVKLRGFGLQRFIGTKRLASKCFGDARQHLMQARSSTQA